MLGISSQQFRRFPRNFFLGKEVWLKAKRLDTGVRWISTTGNQSFILILALIFKWRMRNYSFMALFFQTKIVQTYREFCISQVTIWKMPSIPSKDNYMVFLGPKLWFVINGKAIAKGGRTSLDRVESGLEQTTILMTFSTVKWIQYIHGEIRWLKI